MDTAATKKKKPKGDNRIDRPVSDEDWPWEIASDLDDYIEFHEGEVVLRETMAPATPGQRAIYSCVWYEYEVCNGGHEQFFWNSTGILCDEALAGFIRLGATEYAAVLKAATSLFPNGTPSKDRKTRKEQLEKIPKEDLNRLDNSLYELKEQQGFDETLIRYVRTHPEEFFIQ
ncbi:MAG: DMP19 family protein [Desulfomonile tiedjei]|nr:DMP19 family protein [Desulfomonile tiedjei]